MLIPISFGTQEIIADSLKTIRSELQNVETLGITKPGPARLLTHDLHIWSSHVKGLMLKPSLGEGSIDHSWVSADEELLFQRYIA